MTSNESKLQSVTLNDFSNAFRDVLSQIRNAKKKKKKKTFTAFSNTNVFVAHDFSQALSAHSLTSWKPLSWVY